LLQAHVVLQAELCNGGQALYTVGARLEENRLEVLVPHGRVGRKLLDDVVRALRRRAAALVGPARVGVGVDGHRHVDIEANGLGVVGRGPERATDQARLLGPALGQVRRVVAAVERARRVIERAVDAGRKLVRPADGVRAHERHRLVHR
jgi:hypothetical protein